MQTTLLICSCILQLASGDLVNHKLILIHRYSYTSYIISSLFQHTRHCHVSHLFLHQIDVSSHLFLADMIQPRARASCIMHWKHSHEQAPITHQSVSCIKSLLYGPARHVSCIMYYISEYLYSFYQFYHIMKLSSGHEVLRWILYSVNALHVSIESHMLASAGAHSQNNIIWCV